MTETRPSTFSRRTFLRSAGAAGMGALLLNTTGDVASSAEQQVLPQRTLGRTKRQVSILALGTWPCGKSSAVDTAAVIQLVGESLDLGITFVDTAGAYGKAEEAIGIALAGRRDGVFLASKVWANTADEADRSLSTSLQKLRTDYLDLVYVHSIGDRDVEQVMGTRGSLEYLAKKKEEGVIRAIGISGHARPDKFPPLIKSGVIDVLMVAMNFVDCHTYGFDTKVLPLAREHGLGIAAMKVFGGMKGGFPAASGPNTGPMMPENLKQQAVRYALGIPDVATLVIGPHTLDQLRDNVRMVKEYEPLSDTEMASLMETGRQLASTWGPHYGPVT